jgi:hypothetical protein
MQPPNARVEPPGTQRYRPRQRNCAGQSEVVAAKVSKVNLNSLLVMFKKSSRFCQRNPSPPSSEGATDNSPGQRSAATAALGNRTQTLPLFLVCGCSPIFSVLAKQEYKPCAHEAEQKKKRQRPSTSVEWSERHWRIQRIKQRLTDMCNDRLQKQMPVSQIHPHHPEGNEKPDGVKNTKRDRPKDALP